MKRLTTVVAFAILLCLAPGCRSFQPAPPTLSPAAQIAHNDHRIQEALDLVRDTAQDANAAVPSLLSTDATRQIVLWHESAIKILKSSTDGRYATILTAMEQLVTRLKPADTQQLSPYFTLVRTILKEID